MVQLRITRGTCGGRCGNRHRAFFMRGRIKPMSMPYWPLSAICASPLLTPQARHELSKAYCTTKISFSTFDCCGAVAENSPSIAMNGLILIKDISSCPKHAYLHMPTYEQWSLMERACMILDFDGQLMLLLNPLH